MQPFKACSSLFVYYLSLLCQEITDKDSRRSRVCNEVVVEQTGNMCRMLGQSQAQADVELVSLLLLILASTRSAELYPIHYRAGLLEGQYASTFKPTATYALLVTLFIRPHYARVCSL
jgi:hypothetical protein